MKKIILITLSFILVAGILVGAFLTAQAAETNDASALSEETSTAENETETITELVPPEQIADVYVLAQGRFVDCVLTSIEQPLRRYAESGKLPEDQLYWVSVSAFFKSMVNREYCVDPDNLSRFVENLEGYAKENGRPYLNAGYRYPIAEEQYGSLMSDVPCYTVYTALTLDEMLKISNNDRSMYVWICAIPSPYPTCKNDFCEELKSECEEWRKELESARENAKKRGDLTEEEYQMTPSFLFTFEEYDQWYNRFYIVSPTLDAEFDPADN